MREGERVRGADALAWVTERTADWGKSLSITIIYRPFSGKSLQLKRHAHHICEALTETR